MTHILLDSVNDEQSLSLFIN